ncbi:MAG: aspartyl protease family protein [Henriciella sp.]|uniref:aspartyl protease family protein n=1 Tax=Henriciella sp. TaxID=1968823 RepID=UPI002607F9EC|nr:aspartyl protease family protein [Henriciella sp.]
MKRILAMLAGLAAIIVFAAAANASQDSTIPFEMTATGHLVVDVTLNGEMESRAIVDTGATFALIDHRTAASIGAVPDELAPTIDIIGLGTVGTFPVIEVGSITFGDVSMSDMTAAYNSQYPLPGARNVIPASGIPHRTLDFDFKNSRLRAYDRRPIRLHNSTTSRLPVQWIATLPFIELTVNGRKGLALIDTGSSVSYINSAFAENAAKSPEDFRTLELVGATGNVIPLRVLRSRRFELGDFRIRRLDVIVSDPEFLSYYGLEGQPVMVLGLDILKQFRLQLDRETSELRISRPGLSRRNSAGFSMWARQ